MARLKNKEIEQRYNGMIGLEKKNLSEHMSKPLGMVGNRLETQLRCSNLLCCWQSFFFLLNMSLFTKMHFRFRAHTKDYSTLLFLFVPVLEFVCA